jgi:hypothetical protein
MYLFNSTEWCYIKHTTDNVLQIVLQASRWRVKTANTMKKVKCYANTPTWNKNSGNSQCKAWICKKNYHVYKPIRIEHSYIRCNYITNINLGLPKSWLLSFYGDKSILELKHEHKLKK